MKPRGRAGPLQLLAPSQTALATLRNSPADNSASSPDKVMVANYSAIAHQEPHAVGLVRVEPIPGQVFGTGNASDTGTKRHKRQTGRDGLTAAHVLLVRRIVFELVE